MLYKQNQIRLLPALIDARQIAEKKGMKCRSKRRQILAYFTLVLGLSLFISLPLFAGVEDDPIFCQRAYSALQAASKNIGRGIVDVSKAAWSGTLNYSKDVWNTRGARIILRPESPEDIVRDRRWLGFWAQQYPHEKTWTQRLWSKFRDLLPETRITPKPKPADPGMRHYRLGIVHGLDYNLNRIPRAISNSLGYHNVYIRGISDTQKVFSFPAAFSVALFTPLGVLYNLDIEALSALMNRWKEHKDWLRANHELTAGDYRFNDIYLEYKKAMAERDAMIKKGVPKKEVEAFEEKILSDSIAALQEEESCYTDFFDTDELFRPKYAMLTQQNASPSAYHELDKARIDQLLKNPLLADIPDRMNLPREQLTSPAHLDLTNRIVTLREELFQRYAIIPNIVAGGSAKEKILDKNMGYQEDVASITGSPIYKVLIRLQREGKIDSDTTNRYLMEDSYWQLNRFAIAKALGQTEMVPGEDGKPTNTPLKISDVYNEMLQELWAEKKLPGDYSSYLK